MRYITVLQGFFLYQLYFVQIDELFFSIYEKPRFQSLACQLLHNSALWSYLAFINPKKELILSPNFICGYQLPRRFKCYCFFLHMTKTDDSSEKLSIFSISYSSVPPVLEYIICFFSCNINRLRTHLTDRTADYLRLLAVAFFYDF